MQSSKLILIPIALAASAYILTCVGVLNPKYREPVIYVSLLVITSVLCIIINEPILSFCILTLLIIGILSYILYNKINKRADYVKKPMYISVIILSVLLVFIIIDFFCGWELITTTVPNDGKSISFLKLFHIVTILGLIFTSLTLVYMSQCMKYIAIEYGEDIFDKLKLFGGRKLLLNYISHSYRINQRSKETVTMKPELRDFFFNEYKFGFDQNVQLNMDHILYNFMRHDAISLANVVNYEITKDTPVNLKSSYDKSVKIAKKLHDVDGSLAWFVNQRIPKTYIEASSVIDTLERSFEIYYKNPNIDVRRIHLFYKKYLTYDMSSKIPYMNTKALFNTLLLEYMHGVNSKVLCIEDYDMVSKILFKNGNDIANNHLFLLDFALYYSKSGSSTDSKKDYLSGEPHILCADFTADDPDEKMKTPEQEFSFRQKEYERNKVYVFDSPIIYSVFKNYFLSLWNLEKYICYLTYHIQGKENWEYYAELDKLNKTLEGGIKVYNFIQFWQMAEKSFGTSTLFDHKIFESNYLWGESDCKDKIIKDIQDILNSFDIRGSFRESNEVTFTKLTDALGDHIKRKIYLCQNYS